MTTQKKEEAATVSATQSATMNGGKRSHRNRMTNGRWEHRSLFDIEDVSQLARVRQMHAAHVSQRDMEEFAARYHYTGWHGNTPWRWGLWHGVILYGVVSYNLPTMSVCESIFGKEHWSHVWHMSRLALAEIAPHNSESRLIGQSLRAIEREYPHVWAVLSYAAQDQGHIGYVYQATNALYTGTGGDVRYYVDTDGNRRSTYIDGHGISAQEAAARGWEVHKSLPKHRYIYILGNKHERRARRELLRLDEYPYPKPDNAHGHS